VSRAALLAALCACRHPAPIAPPEPLPPDVPIPRTDGVVAGPHYVVDAAPPPDLPADVPGQGVLSPYVSLIRKDLAERMTGCTSAPSGHGALLKLSLRSDGSVDGALVARSSGDAAWDGCLVSSVEAGPFEPPPPELVASGGVFAVDLVFR
jgi:hypothetical protein